MLDRVAWSELRSRRTSSIKGSVERSSVADRRARTLSQMAICRAIRVAEGCGLLVDIGGLNMSFKLANDQIDRARDLL